MVSNVCVLELGKMIRNKPFCFKSQITTIIQDIKISKMERNVKTELVHYLVHLFFNLNFGRDMEKLILWHQVLPQGI